MLFTFCAAKAPAGDTLARPTTSNVVCATTTQLAITRVSSHACENTNLQTKFGSRFNAVRSARPPAAEPHPAQAQQRQRQRSSTHKPAGACATAVIDGAFILVEWDRLP